MTRKGTRSYRSIPATPAEQSEEKLHSAGQRSINSIWEYTQASIAIITVLSNVAYVFILITMGEDVSEKASTAATLLANAFFLVIGFYFGRTNHARIDDRKK